jgi:zinc transporter ZupT
MDTSTILFAFGLTLFAGLSTGIGSALAFFAKKTNTDFFSVDLGFSAGVRTIFNKIVFGVLFASAAWIMVSISLDELLPAAQKYGKHHLSIYGLIIGMAVMALSLLLFA